MFRSGAEVVADGAEEVLLFDHFLPQPVIGHFQLARPLDQLSLQGRFGLPQPLL